MWTASKCFERGWCSCIRSLNLLSTGPDDRCGRRTHGVQVSSGVSERDSLENVIGRRDGPVAMSSSSDRDGSQADDGVDVSKTRYEGTNRQVQ